MNDSLIKKIACFSLLFYGVSSLSSYALVEYDDNSGGGVRVKLKEKLQQRMSVPKGNSNIKINKIPRNNGPQLTQKMFNVGLAYENLNVKQEGMEGSVGLVRMGGQFQMPINIFLDFSYYGGKTESKELSKENSFQKGNAKFIVGFNWLKVGNFEDQMRIDIYGGFSAAEKRSALGSSRNDKVFGLRTSKNFYTVMLGLIGEINLTGSPDNKEETSIGNITKLGGAVGWVVSNDIRFEAEYNNYFIKSSDDDDSPNNLANDVSFGVVSPRILLRFFGGVDFSLGTHFQTKKKLDTRPLLKAKLYDIPGVYGNSVSLGLNFSM